MNYKFINKKDISYANVKRGTIRIKISNNLIPTESEFNKIALDSWKKHRGHWKVGSVYLYVKDMPVNSTAYAVAKIKDLKIDKFTVNAWILELHERSKKKE